MTDLKLVVLDCDGVMFDSREANRAYYGHLRGHFGRPPLTEAEVAFVHAHPAPESVPFIFRTWPQEIERVNAYRAARGEYFVLVSAGDTLDRTFAERHLYMHRYAALCMVTSSDFRLAGPRGELVHEACLASTRTSLGRVMTRPFERGLQQWSFSPRSANVFRRWPAIDCFFDHLARMGRESSDGTAEWLLLYYAQALGGSFRWAECLGTLALRPDDRVMDVARGLPAFGTHPALNVDRVRVFLFGLLCTHHEQLVALVTPATLGGFARWLRAGASPQVIALMKSQAVAAGADPRIVAMLDANR